jgi:hypothetical protein
MKMLACALGVALLTGCASQLRITYDSDPRGATLYQNGQPFGTTPVTLNYQADQTFRNGGCMALRGTEVKWASGASASISSLTACSSTGYQQLFTFMRPDVPGRDIDANFALQLQRNRIMQQSNAIQLYNATRPAPTVRCSSRQVGFTVQTVCN